MHYVADIGPIHLIALDSEIVAGDVGDAGGPDGGPGAGADGGPGAGPDGGPLEWLEQQLAAAPEQPTIVALHRPPFALGLGETDSNGIEGSDADANSAANLRAIPRNAAENELARIVARHRQVERVICGHVHRVVTGELAGRVTITAPSTYVELEPAG